MRPRSSGVRQFALAPDRRILYYTRVGDDDAPKLISCKPGDSNAERVWRLSDDGRVFVVHKRGSSTHPTFPGFWIFEATTGRCLLEDVSRVASPTRPLPVAVSPDGKRYARTRLSDGKILLGEVPFDAKPPGGPVP